MLMPIIYYNFSTCRKFPSSFLRKHALHQQTSSKKSRVYVYDRDIICLPKTFVAKGGLIRIPRRQNDRKFLVTNKLIGKVQLKSPMTEREIFQEIRSVFRTPMGYDKRFRFTVLQTSGRDSKCLMVPELSRSYKWTASAIAGRNAKVPIYILAEDELQVYMYMLHVSIGQP